MSTHRKIEWTVFILGLCGFLFSGYLSSVKFFSETCAFSQECPYFLGFPACYFGFAMYTVIVLFAGLHVFHLYDGKKANLAVLTVSFLGIIFAGYYTLLEVPKLFAEGIVAYLSVLPTCAIGLIFYVTIGLLSLRLRKDFTK